MFSLINNGCWKPWVWWRMKNLLPRVSSIIFRTECSLYSSIRSGNIECEFIIYHCSSSIFKSINDIITVWSSYCPHTKRAVYLLKTRGDSHLTRFLCPFCTNTWTHLDSTKDIIFKWTIGWSSKHYGKSWSTSIFTWCYLKCLKT